MFSNVYIKMNVIFINSENIKTSKQNVFALIHTNKLDLRIDEKVIALSNLSIFYTWRDIKNSCNNNKSKTSAPTWNNEFELPDGSYSVSNIQDYFEYILKKHGEHIDEQSVKIYVSEIENRITFEIKKGYSLELVTPETMKLLGSTENKITEDKNGENLPKLEITFIVPLLIIIIRKIQEYCTPLFPINRWVAYQKFLK